MMDSKGGFVPLPTILNGKTVDPQSDTSTKVWQLETAMGAAIECFSGQFCLCPYFVCYSSENLIIVSSIVSGAAAVCVSRDRFAPVKKCSDLLLLRSDAYVVHPMTSVLMLNPATMTGYCIFNS